MRKRLRALLLIPAAWLLASACAPGTPGPAPTTDVNAARDAVAKLRSDWIAAANRDDAAAVARTYTEDATLMTAEGVVGGSPGV